MPLLQSPVYTSRCNSVAQLHAVRHQPLLCPGAPRHQQHQQQLQQRQQCRCSAAENAAEAAAAAPSVPTQMDEQPDQINIPRPLGPDEPAQEEPKKLSAAARLSEMLTPTSTSITIIGDDTDLNWAVCQTLSKAIGWFPVSTAKILLGMNKASSIQEIVDKQGQAALAAAEAGVIRGMRDQYRCCLATVGNGAAADAALYTNIYGSIIIWLDEVDKRNPKPLTAARAVYQEQSEVRVQLQTVKGGFGQKEMTPEEKAKKATSDIVKAMNKLLKDHDYLPAKKRLYVECGCRGDWPELKPKEWNPVLEGLERKAVAAEDTSC